MFAKANLEIPLHKRQHGTESVTLFSLSYFTQQLHLSGSRVLCVRLLLAVCTNENDELQRYQYLLIWRM